MTTDLRIREALHDLAEAPQPEGLADRALRGAARRSVARIAGAGATAVVTTLAAVAAVQFARVPAPQPAAPPACVQYPPTIGALLPPEQWPDFAAAAIAAMPPGPEYGVYGAAAWCDPDDNSSTSNVEAWAIIVVGDFAAWYSLQIFLRLDPPVGCSGERPPGFLFCREATANTPQVYAALDGPEPLVSAVYADGTGIMFRPYGHAEPGTPMLSAEQLADVAADPGLYATIPGHLRVAVAPPGSRRLGHSQCR